MQVGVGSGIRQRGSWFMTSKIVKGGRQDENNN